VTTRSGIGVCRNPGARGVFGEAASSLVGGLSHGTSEKTIRLGPAAVRAARG